MFNRPNLHHRLPVRSLLNALAKRKKAVHAPQRHPDSGFTVAELIISTTLLSVLLMVASGVFTNLYNALRNLRAANQVYEEANFVMERIVKEVRNGTIDYEEYYNQNSNFFGSSQNETYGQNYCQYSRQFYSPGPDGQYGTFDDESTGERLPGSAEPISSPVQDRLYLIDQDGLKRTYFKKIVIGKKSGNDWSDLVGRVAMLKLVGKDNGIDHVSAEEGIGPCFRDTGEKDGLIDTWVCENGFKCAEQVMVLTTFSSDGTQKFDCHTTLRRPLDQEGEIVGNEKGVVESVDNALGITAADFSSTSFSGSSFVDITPDTLDIVDLKFIVTPKDDPYKAYNSPEVQEQPNVTVKLVARASKKIAGEFSGQTPTIVLESTVSARTNKRVVTECNLQECLAEDRKPCPKHSGILANAEQTCDQGVWPGCTEAEYKDFAAQYVIENFATLVDQKVTDILEGNGLDHSAVWGPEGNSFYETASELGSCEKIEDASQRNACKSRRCGDYIDNDADGLTDPEDPDCLLFTCNDGIKEPYEACRDVGGPCYMHPLLEKEDNEGMTTCSDGLDNDCSYDSEITWSAVAEDSNDDPAVAAKKKEKRDRILAYDPTLEGSSDTARLNIALGQGADEYDLSCVESICGNGQKDPPIGLNKQFFGAKYIDDPSYLFGEGYGESSDLAETCSDVGGLCDRLDDEKKTKADGENTYSLCHDGIDNDCDYVDGAEGTGADEFDSDCWGTTTTAICGNGQWECNLADRQKVIEQTYALGEGKTYSLWDLVDFKQAYNPICSVPPSQEDTALPPTTPPRRFIDYDSVRLLGEFGLNESCPDRGGQCAVSDKQRSVSTSEAMTVDSDGNEYANPKGCSDGVDNDCDGYLDFNDSDCCADQDGDGYFPQMSVTVGTEKVWICDPGQPNIDCNDDMTSYPTLAAQVHPGASEICDSASYLGGSLSGQPIDDNCSGVNGLSNKEGGVPSSLDADDLACCEDTDNDGFGAFDASLCEGSPAPSSTTYDCDVLDILINPAASEGTKAMCSDKKPNACRILDAGDPTTMADDQFKMDHIDLFPDSADAAANSRFNPDCCLGLATTPPADLYPVGAMAWNYPGVEICNDSNNLDPAKSGQGSDENCNGKEGLNDHFCVYESNLKMFDNLSTGAFVASTDRVSWIASSSLYAIAADETEGFVFSGAIPKSETCGEGRLVLAADILAESDPADGTGLEFSISRGNDEWTDYMSKDPGTGLYATDFAGLADGNNLRWKARLSRLNATDPSPELRSVAVGWTCD